MNKQNRRNIDQVEYAEKEYDLFPCPVSPVNEYGDHQDGDTNYRQYRRHAKYL